MRVDKVAMLGSRGSRRLFVSYLPVMVAAVAAGCGPSEEPAVAFALASPSQLPAAIDRPSDEWIVVLDDVAKCYPPRGTRGSRR